MTQLGVGDPSIDPVVPRRRFGRLGWMVSSVGYGMWGVAGGEGGWTGTDEQVGRDALQHAVDLGCNFFDTARIYGRGHGERLLGWLVAANPTAEMFVATKVPPLDGNWPPRPGARLDEVFPEHHIVDSTEKSLEAIGVDTIDLLQFHVWEDDWADDERWQRAVSRLRDDGLVRGVGISVNRWEPANVVKALMTGLVDAVQVIYNIFDQAPEDELFGVCRDLDVAVIARVPFDEGTLTGTLRLDSRWPAGDWRSVYFGPENLGPSVQRADRLAQALPPELPMPEAALRFVLASPTVATVIPGMRRRAHVDRNLAVSRLPPLDGDVLAELRRHRWDRVATEWSG